MIIIIKLPLKLREGQRGWFRGCFARKADPGIGGRMPSTRVLPLAAVADHVMSNERLISRELPVSTFSTLIFPLLLG